MVETVVLWLSLFIYLFISAKFARLADEHNYSLLGTALLAFLWPLVVLTWLLIVFVVGPLSKWWKN